MSGRNYRDGRMLRNPYNQNVRLWFDMAILAIITGAGNTTKDAYEKLRKEVDWEHRQPPGGIFHAASVDNSGNIHVADVWESEEQLNSFFKDRLKPAMQKFNIPEPRVEVFQIHNVDAFPGLDKYKV